MASRFRNSARFSRAASTPCAELRYPGQPRGRAERMRKAWIFGTPKELRAFPAAARLAGTIRSAAYSTRPTRSSSGLSGKSRRRVAKCQCGSSSRRVAVDGEAVRASASTAEQRPAAMAVLFATEHGWCWARHPVERGCREPWQHCSFRATKLQFSGQRCIAAGPCAMLLEHHHVLWRQADQSSWALLLLRS